MEQTQCELAGAIQASENREIRLSYRDICDLRQPLTVAKGRVQLARLKARKGDHNQVYIDLRIIEEQCDRLAVMLSQLASDGVVKKGHGLL